MKKETIIKSIGLRPNVAHVSEELLNDLVEDAFNDIRNYIHYRNEEEIPDTLSSVVKNMVISVVNRFGAEGIVTQSFSGASFNFIEGISEGDLKKLRRERRFGYRDKDSQSS